jgi:hypothetical protein
MTTRDHNNPIAQAFAATPSLRLEAHTPTPWYYNQDEGADPKDGHNINTAEHVICDLPDMGDGEAPHTEGNARFIVRACNAFAGLVGALNDMISDIEAGNTEWITKGTLAYAKRELVQAVGARAAVSGSPEPSNEDRALRAETALRQFRRETGIGHDREAVGDLIADLGHYCDERGLDFDELVRRGVEHWRAELQAGASPTRTTASCHPEQPGKAG